VFVVWQFGRNAAGVKPAMNPGGGDHRDEEPSRGREYRAGRSGGPMDVARGALAPIGALAVNGANSPDLP
jgi:hypothetical protein